MERILAVVDPTEVAKNVVREAGEIAEEMGVEIVLVHVTTDEEYSRRRGAMEALPKATTSYTHDDAQKGATQFARDIGEEILMEFAVEYETIGALGNKAAKILDVATEYNCDHIFLTGRQRSPTGKALFGDAAQRVILEFEGFVTVTTS